jgi:hypothetical protein
MFSFVIPLSDLNESPEIAIKSILAHKKYAKDVKVVYAGYSGEDHSLYNGWHEDKKKLNIQVIPILDLKYFDNDTALVVEVPPFAQMYLGDFENLEKQSQESTSLTQTQFSLGTTLTSQYSSILYGFLMIMTVMEWFINRLWYNGKFIQNTDIRCRFVVTKGVTRHIGNDYSYVWNILNREVKRKQYSNAIIDVGINNQVVNWILSKHKMFSFGLWILAYVPFYIFVSLSFSSMVLYSWSPWIVVGAGSGIWLFEILISFLICRSYCKIPYLLAYCIMFPLYWITFPYALLYFKFSI